MLHDRFCWLHGILEDILAILYYTNPLTLFLVFLYEYTSANTLYTVLFVYTFCGYLLLISPKPGTVEWRSFIFYVTVLIRKTTRKLQKACQFLSLGNTPCLVNHLHSWKYDWGVVIAFSIVTFICTSLIIKKVRPLFPMHLLLVLIPPIHYPCSFSPFVSESKAKILYTYFLQRLTVLSMPGFSEFMCWKSRDFESQPKRLW